MYAITFSFEGRINILVLIRYIQHIEWGFENSNPLYQWVLNIFPGLRGTPTLWMFDNFYHSGYILDLFDIAVLR